MVAHMLHLIQHYFSFINKPNMHNDSDLTSIYLLHIVLFLIVKTVVTVVLLIEISNKFNYTYFILSRYSGVF
jgi:hypothetical protein